MLRQEQRVSPHPVPTGAQRPAVLEESGEGFPVRGDAAQAAMAL